jgi:N-acetylglucosaminyldiphosphoundecaprenol N-acetyl-beta-D-mannosaminyltransferase
MTAIPRYNVLGVGVSALTLDQARDLVIGIRGRTRCGYICHCTVHSVGEARKDPAYRRLLNASWLTTPDGMPLVWMAHRQGHRGVTRVYGPDLMLAVCDAGRASGLRHYFYGGAPGVAATLRERLCARFPGLAVVGAQSPPFHALTGEELDGLQKDISGCRPDVIWVGLGTPKQDRFMAEVWDQLDAGVMIGVGAAFDFLSGAKKQAPRWMQRSGLEWLFRLGQEPRRLACRYLVYNPLFLLRTGAQLTGLKKYPLGNQPGHELHG